MEIGSTLVTPRPPAVTDTQRAAIVAAPEAVRTELPAAAVVSQAVEAQASGSGDGAPERLERRVIIDSDTQSLVYQALDDRTGTVVKQYPEEALLRRRAYLAQVTDEQIAEAVGSRPVEVRA
jgi:hypothetical protein